jgi:hypothetical protein
VAQRFTIPNVAYLDFNPAADASHPFAGMTGTVVEDYRRNDCMDEPERQWVPDAEFVERFIEASV